MLLWWQERQNKLWFRFSVGQNQKFQRHKQRKPQIWHLLAFISWTSAPCLTRNICMAACFYSSLYTFLAPTECAHKIEAIVHHLLGRSSSHVASRFSKSCIINCMRTNEKRPHCRARQTLWRAWSCSCCILPGWKAGIDRELDLPPCFLQWSEKFVDLSLSLGMILKTEISPFLTAKVTDCGGATRRRPWRFTCCLCSEIVALLWVEVKWMQMCRQRGRPAVYSHAVCLTLLCVCLDILCSAFGNIFQRTWKMSDSLCPLQPSQMWKYLSAFPHCGKYLTISQPWTVWLLMKLSTVAGIRCPLEPSLEKKNCIRIAKIRRWDQTLNCYFHPASSVCY